jgi:hypothetical protein
VRLSRKSPPSTKELDDEVTGGSIQHGRELALGGLNTRKTDKTGMLWVDRVAGRRS